MQDDTNKKKLGCFKDELNGMVMREFLGFNPKYYAFKYKNIEKKKAKGVSKAVVDKLITFNDYKNTLETNKPPIREVVSIRSFNQQLFTYKQEQIALTSFYDKMKMIDTINCEPYGYIEYGYDDINNNIIIEEVKEVEDVIPNNDIIIIQEIEDIKIKDVEIQEVEIKENIINNISNRLCPFSKIPDNIYLKSIHSTNIIDNYYNFMCINNIRINNLIYDDKYINGELITTFKINLLKNIKPKPKLYITNKSYRYNFNYSIDNNNISDKYSELIACTII
jgi:hypothetical protein